MTRTFRTALFALLALAMAAVPLARAAEERVPAASPQAYVVLVGISQYADAQILPRPHAEDDAKALHDLFADKQYLGAGPDHVRLLLGTADPGRRAELATRQRIVDALAWAAKSAGRDDLVVFAFMGQGGPLADRACYFATDSTFADRARNTVAAADIEHALEKLKSARVCMFIDVNFKGWKTDKDNTLEPARENLFKEFQGADAQISSGRAIFLASNGFMPAIDAGAHGLFTKLVVAGLKGAADKEGYEADGVVTVNELKEYLDKEMPGQVRELAKTDKDKEQRHFVLRGGSSNFVLTRDPGAMPKVEERLAGLARLAEAGTIAKELAAEGKELLGRMPKLKARQELRRAYQKLADAGLTPADFEKERTRILDSTRLDRTAATAFAAKVLRAAQLVRERHVKEVKLADMVAWAIRGLYGRVDESIPREVSDRLDKLSDSSDAELTAILADARQNLGRREDLDNHKDIDFALQRMTARLDPYTTYFDPETLVRWTQDTTRRYTGIGLQISVNAARDMLQVVTPFKDSPAHKAGLLAGDIITTFIRDVDSDGVDLPNREVLSTRGMSTADAVKKLLGKPGTRVKVIAEREGADKPIEVELTRAVVEMETVLGPRRRANADWDYYVDQQHKIAYVYLTNFAPNTARDLARIVSLLEKQGIGGFILDLRFNPGGSLTSAVAISDLFVDDGLIVKVKPRVGREQSYTGHSPGSKLDFPMVCLVNGRSASGSEIVSACLQDQHRAIVMGERSYGKGSVQHTLPFDQGELKVTVASFWRPSGKNLNKSSTSGKEEEDWGVSPDQGFVLKLDPRERDLLADHLARLHVIPRRDASPGEARPGFRDRQLEMALDYLRSQIKASANGSAKKAG